MGKVNSRNKAKIEDCSDREVLIGMSKAFVSFIHTFNLSIAKMAGKEIISSDPGQIYIHFNDLNVPSDMSFDLIKYPPLTKEEDEEMCMLGEIEQDDTCPMTSIESNRLNSLLTRHWHSLSTLEQEAWPSPGVKKIDCKYVKREGESCTLNNKCKYPYCKDSLQ